MEKMISSCSLSSLSSPPSLSLRSLLSSSDDDDDEGGETKQNFVLGLIAAVGSPVLYAIVNCVDKAILSKSVVSVEGYVPVVGLMDILIGVVFGVALGDWSKPSSFLDYLWPVLSGFMQGAAVYFYLFALDKYDASNVTGFENFYPVLVAVISSIFLGERIDLFGYLGIALSTVGAVAISLNMTKVHIPLVSDFVMKHTRKSASEQLCWIERRDPNLSNDDVRCWTPLSLCDANTASSESKRLIDDEERGSQGTHEVSPAPRWLPLVIIIPLIVCVALNVVFTKVAVSDLDSNSVASINFVSFGVLLMLALVVPGSRSNCVAEMKRNWLFALVSQILTCSSLYLIVVAVGRIDASITSALNCLQPVTVLVLERALRFSSESWAECVSYKVVPILFIAVGVTLLTCSVLF